MLGIPIPTILTIIRSSSDDLTFLNFRCFSNFQKEAYDGGQDSGKETKTSRRTTCCSSCSDQKEEKAGARLEGHLSFYIHQTLVMRQREKATQFDR